jgi:nicotinate-nucleotide adenylyltransferase
MKTGLFFGSFNPIHQGHLILARHILNLFPIQEIWFVVSPHNPLKEKQTLLNDYERLHLVEMAIENHAQLQASTIEFKLPQPSYTIHTLTHLSEKYPKREFYLIMGADNLEGLHKWKNAELILERYFILVYPRLGYDGSAYKNNPHVFQVNAPVIELSATQIRQFIREGKPIDFMVPENVRLHIEKEQLYR